jgi:hypothetical protein
MALILTDYFTLCFPDTAIAVSRKLGCQLLIIVGGFELLWLEKK